MGLSKLAERCRICPKVDTCNHKRMEAYGYLVPCPEHRHGGMVANVVICDDIGYDTIVPKAPEFEAVVEQLRVAMSRAIGAPYDMLYKWPSQLWVKMV